MNKKFISIASKSFCDINNLPQQDITSCEQYLTEFFEQLHDNMNDVYLHVNENIGTTDKLSFLRGLLEYKYISELNPEINAIYHDLLQHININELDDYLSEAVQDVRTRKEYYMDKIIGFGGLIGGSLISVLIGGLLLGGGITLVYAIKSLLDVFDDGTEKSIVIVGLILILWRIWVERGDVIKKNVKEIVDAIIGVFKFSTSVSFIEGTTEQKLRKKIILANINNCRDRCGVEKMSASELTRLVGALLRNRSIDPELIPDSKIPQRDINNSVGGWLKGGALYATDAAVGAVEPYSNNVKSRHGSEEFYNERIRSQADCLLHCYLDFITTSYAEMSSAYVNCLTNAGETVDLKELSMDFLMKYSPSEHCAEIHKKMYEAMDDFHNIMSWCFKKDNKQIQYWINILDNKVKNVRQNIHIKPQASGVPTIQGSRMQITPYRSTLDKKSFIY
jgi:hypothetical protein